MFKLIILLIAFFIMPEVSLAHGVFSVRMTPGGFEPNEINADVNAGIDFINEDNVSRWPASDIHPTHLIYPDFDPKKEIKPGESWSFKPKKPGTFKFHDHLFPDKKGTLVILPEEGQQEKNLWQKFLDWCSNLFKNKIFSRKELDLSKEIDRILKDGRFRLREEGENIDLYLRAQMDICYKSGGRDDCYKDLAFLLFHQFDLSLILSLLTDNEKYPEVFSRCHQLTHYLTRLAYKSQGSILKVYDQCTSVCHGGCYHGAIEEYLSEKNLIEDGINYQKISSELPRVCGQKKDFKVPLLFDECIHGIGHGTMYVTDGNLVDSLKMCDVLGNQKDRETCYSGAFMENSSSSTNLDHPSKFIKKEDPMYPCNILEEKYLALCYRYQSSHFTIISQSNWQEVARLCMMVPDSYKKPCFLTVGSNLVGFTRDLNVIVQNCKSMPEAHKADCYQGAADALAIRYRDDVSWGRNFCSLTESTYQESCFIQYGQSLSSWSDNPENRDDQCNKLNEAKFVAWCKGENEKSFF